MNPLLQKSFNQVIAFVFLCCLFPDHLLATPTPTCPIVTERFQGLTDGTTVNNSGTGWYLDASHVAGTSYFAMKSNRFHAQELGGEGIWYSKVFSVAGYTDVQVATKITAEGDMNSSEYVKIYYKINGGAEILLDQRTGNFGTIDFISPVFNGNNVQLVIKIYNYNNGGSQTSKYYIEEYRVFKEHGPCAGSIAVSATAGNSGVLTCTNPSLTLSASTTASGTTTYSWTGPNGFTSTAQNPVVSAAGTYNVVGTNSAGSGSATVTITENKTAPPVTATGGSLACASTVTINATSPVTNATYSWTGPNSFTSTLKSPTVSAAGTYTVLVTNPANGCTASQSVQVVSGSGTPAAFWLEDFTLANGSTIDTGATAWTIENTGTGTFSVQNNEFKTSYSSAAEGRWYSQPVNISGKSNVVISVGLRSETASSSDFFETDDYIRVYYTLDNGAEVLIYEDIAGIGSTTTGTAAVTISSAALNGSDLQIIVKTRNSNTTELYFFDNVQLSGVDRIVENATAAVSGPLTCATDSVTLLGGSAVSGVTYNWTGPNGFTSTLQNPAVSTVGAYILTITNPSTGCTGTASATVVFNATTTGTIWLEDFTLTSGTTVDNGPTGWSTQVSPSTGIIAVNNQELRVTNIGTTGEAVWTSGVIDIAGKTNVSIASGVRSAITGGAVMNSSGEYADYLRFYYKLNTGAEVLFSEKTGIINNHSTTHTLVSIDSLSGTSLQIIVKARATGNDEFYYFDNIQVTATSESNVDATAAADGILTCTNTSVTLSGNSTTPGATYSWSGPNAYTSALQNTAVNAPGNYTLTVTTQVGCAATAVVSVVQHADYPYVTVEQSGTAVTCIDSVTLTGTTGTAAAKYQWSGPDGFSASTAVIAVTRPGVYQLHVTDSTNGCSTFSGAQVSGDITPPAGVTAFSSNELNCFRSNTNLAGTSTTPGVIFNWSGPDGFTSPQADTSVTVPGTYILRVTNPGNGCFETAFVTVIRNIAPPADVTATNDGPLTCAATSVMLTGSSSTPGVDYSWTGPDEFVSFSPVETVTVPGEYVLVVTNLNNGCSQTVSTTVEEDYSDCITGDATTQKNVTVMAIVNEQKPVPAFEVKTWPNPFTDKMFIEFRSPENAPVMVRLYNNTGVCEKVVFNDRVKAGQLYKLTITGNMLHAGIYYCIIRVNDKVYPRKLLVVK